MRVVSLDDAELVRQVQSGRTEAYGTLVRKYQDRVFNACWRIAGHLEDARDVTQDAFIKALEGLAAFRGESGFYTWLFRIAVNLAITRKRDAARHRMGSLDSASLAAGTQAERLLARSESAASAEPDPSLSTNIAAALQALDAEQRAVVVLRDIEGFDYAEISDILGVPAGTVKSRLHRARAALADMIRPAQRKEA